MVSCCVLTQASRRVTSKRLGVTTQYIATKLMRLLGLKGKTTHLAKLYANENIPLPVVEHLRVLSHDVLTSLESGKANQRIPDDEVLEFAAESGRAVLTLNRIDFQLLHKARKISHAGIVTCTVDRDFQALAYRIHAKLEKAGS